jgi:hypothetical protein
MNTTGARPLAFACSTCRVSRSVTTVMCFSFPRATRWQLRDREPRIGRYVLPILMLRDLQQLTFSQCPANATAAPGPGFGELPECLAGVVMALSAASERLVRLIQFRTQLRDGCTQEFELGALLIAQFDAPIPSLIGLSH